MPKEATCYGEVWGRVIVCSLILAFIIPEKGNKFSKDGDFLRTYEEKKKITKQNILIILKS